MIDKLRKRLKQVAVARATVSREERRTFFNIIFCVVGLALGFLYLKEQQVVGWFFVISFTFLLLTQLSDEEDFDW